MTHDAAGPSVASTGSGSDSEWRFGPMYAKQEYIDEARKASFFGVPVGELTHTELLAAFGSVLKMRIRDQELADSVKKMFRLARDFPW